MNVNMNILVMVSVLFMGLVTISYMGMWDPFANISQRMKSNQIFIAAAVVCMMLIFLLEMTLLAKYVHEIHKGIGGK